MERHTLPPCGVLIVDDCCDTVQSLSLLVSYWGYTPTVAHDGAEALRLAERNRPDVVLLDLAMPKMSGLELARRLRRDLHLHQTLVVSMSGFGQPEYGDEALEAGCDCHFVKPIDPNALRDLLASRRRLEPVGLN